MIIRIHDEIINTNNIVSIGIDLTTQTIICNAVSETFYIRLDSAEQVKKVFEQISIIMNATHVMLGN
jgi:hypothetical protein